MAIGRVKYHNKGKQGADFEIVALERFFATRPKNKLEQDFRMNFWTLIYITDGQGMHSVDFKEYPYKSGDMIVLAKNRVHSFRVNYDVKGYIININEPFFIESSNQRDMDMLSFFETPIDKPIVHMDMSPNATSRQLIDLIYKEYLLAENSVAKKLIKSLLSAFIYSLKDEITSEFHEFSTAAYKNYFEYRELVEHNFKELKAVADYERLMGLTKKTLNAACRECADISAKELITNRIILEAKRLLKQNEMKNYEIAEILCFDEPANLANFFKRNTNVSMSDFRKD